MKCPNCDIELEQYSTGKDMYVSNGDDEMYLGRINIQVCPHCHYYDMQSIWIS